MMGSPPLFHVYSLLVMVILLKPFSNLFLAWGVRHFPQALSSDPSALPASHGGPACNTWDLMQIVWLLARMSLLGVADLSFVSSRHRNRLHSDDGAGEGLSRRTGERAALDWGVPDFPRNSLCQSYPEEGQARSRETAMKWILLAVVVLTTVLADLLQSYEMKRVERQDGHAVRFWRMAGS